MTFLRVVSILLAIFGAILMWRSPVLGLNAARGNMFTGGAVSGMINTELIHGYTAALRTMGAIMMGVGLFRTLERKPD